MGKTALVLVVTVASGATLFGALGGVMGSARAEGLALLAMGLGLLGSSALLGRLGTGTPAPRPSEVPSRVG